MYVLAFLARVFDQGVKLSINGAFVTCVCSFQDAGVNFTVYASHSHIMQYLVSNAKPDSYHHVWGPAIVSAYSSRAGRPAYSMKVDAQKIGLARIPENGQINLASVTWMKDITGNAAQSLKFKFILSLLLLQNWDTQFLDIAIDYERASKVELAEEVLLLQDQLTGQNLLDEQEQVLNIENVVERRQRLRPGAARDLVLLNLRLRQLMVSQLNEPNMLDQVISLGLLVAPVPPAAVPPVPPERHHGGNQMDEED
ncbi:unnamed protein product [Mucor fragilis]